MLVLFAAPILYTVFDFLLYSILPFLFILGFCVTIHEIGHFIFAKIFGIPVEKFSIGFGPPLFRRKIGETDFRIAYFPLGGYVKMVGEEEGEILKSKESVTPDEEIIKLGFYEAPTYKRILVVFGGPLFSIASAVIVIVLTFLIFGISFNPYSKIQVEKGSYADHAGLMDGDSIIAANYKPIKTWDAFEEFLMAKQGEEITILIIRNGQQITKKLMVNIDSLGLTSLVPSVLGTVKMNGPAYRAGMKTGDRVLKIDNAEVKTWNELVEIVRKSIKVSLLFEWQHNDEIKTAYIKTISYCDPITRDTVGQIGVFMPLVRKYLTPLEAFNLSINRSGSLIWLTLKIFYQLIKREVSVKALGGPIAIAKLSAESAQWGLEYLLGLLAIISVNLGIINLFPIPALDGGHILISLIEATRRKRLSKNTRMVIQQIGYAIILLLIIFVTFNDITR